jgi:hypothetical protein
MASRRARSQQASTFFTTFRQHDNNNNDNNTSPHHHHSHEDTDDDVPLFTSHNPFGPSSSDDKPVSRLLAARRAWLNTTTQLYRLLSHLLLTIRFFVHQFWANVKFLFFKAKGGAKSSQQQEMANDIDQQIFCLDCAQPFSLRANVWRIQCRNCGNEFCQRCISSQKHSMFEGSNRAAVNVCTYCYFTLCARYCRCACYSKLSVRQLKRFLSRKGIDTWDALEKRVCFIFIFLFY